MLNRETSPDRKPRFWDGLKLRGRLLALMLAVALSAVLICAVCFVVINNYMLDSVRDDAHTLSDTVNSVVSMFFYQSETDHLHKQAIAAAAYIDSRLAEYREKGKTPDWNICAAEASDYLFAHLAEFETIQTALFIIVNDELYVCGTDKDTLLFKSATI
ncbi:MAG: hypothetical protein LBH28_10210 [Oscillospiraceae bacterium]|jgi:hypothetical protein|nr:hypothetical protein [Oscillospiraceae bacterium]